MVFLVSILFTSRIQEPQRAKTYPLTCAHNEDSSQPAHPHSLSHPHEENLHPWLSKMRLGKILIRLLEFVGCQNLRWVYVSKGTFL